MGALLCLSSAVMGIALVTSGPAKADGQPDERATAELRWVEAAPFVQAALDHDDAVLRQDAIQRLMHLSDIGNLDQRHRSLLALYHLAAKDADEETARHALEQIMAINSGNDRSQTARREFAQDQLDQLPSKLDKVVLQRDGRRMSQLARAGNVVEAIESGRDMIEALRTEEAIRTARWQVAELAYRSRQLEAAREQFDELEKLATDQAELERIHKYLVRILPADEVVQLCRTRIDAAIRDEDDPAYWYEHLARALRSDGDPDAAAEAYEQYLKAHPHSEHAHRIRMLFGRDVLGTDPHKALELFKAAADEAEPGTTAQNASNLYISHALEALGKNEQAIEQYFQTILQGLGSPQARIAYIRMRGLSRMIEKHPIDEAERQALDALMAKLMTTQQPQRIEQILREFDPQHADTSVAAAVQQTITRIDAPKTGGQPGDPLPQESAPQ